MSFTSSNLTNLRTVNKRVADTFKNWGARNQAISKKPRLHYGATPEEIQRAENAKRAELAASRETALGELREIRKHVEIYHRGLVQDIGKVLDRPAPKDTNEALLREMREQRAWSRYKQILDLETSPGKAQAKAQEFAAAALAAGDEDGFAAIRAEMPTYLTARADEASVPIFLGALDESLAKAKPELAPALAARAEIVRGLPWVNTAVNHAEHHIQKGDLNAHLIAWDGSVEQINLEAPATAAA